MHPKALRPRRPCDRGVPTTAAWRADDYGRGSAALGYGWPYPASEAVRALDCRSTRSRSERLEAAPTDPPRWRSVTGANEGFMADLPDSPHGPGSAEPVRPPAGLPTLLRRQDALQTEARAVIRELGLRERLGRLGPFEQIGSSRSGLMVWRDLDVATRCADPTTEEVLDAMRPVLAHPGVREVTYMPQRVAEPVRRARRPALVLRPALRGGGRRAVEGRRLAVAAGRCPARAVLRSRHAVPSAHG
jgi:hypothetical protein